MLDMDPLLPTLCILDTSVPQNRQQCLLKASKEAKALASRNTCYDRNTVKDKKTACEEGNISFMCSHRMFTLQQYRLFFELIIKVITVSMSSAKKTCQPITSTPSEVQYLGQLNLTFGKYNGQSFKWLVENDVGYIK